GYCYFFFFFQAEDGIRDFHVTGVQTCALPICRYGLRAMLDLALHYDDGYISLRHIAERQEISEGYLEQVFAMLKKDGLVKSVRRSEERRVGKECRSRWRPER